MERRGKHESKRERRKAAVPPKSEFIPFLFPMTRISWSGLISPFTRLASLRLSTMEVPPKCE